MAHVKYGIDVPTHDITKEVPCAIVANEQALSSETIFKNVPKVLAAEVATATAGFLILAVYVTKAETQGFGTLEA
jgi:hypothetical protein